MIVWGGFCRCGCGRRTRIATKTSRRDGDVLGRPRDFLLSHRNRGSRLHWTVEERGHDTPCWIWKGVLNNQGYGQIGGGRALAHREIYARFEGPIPEGHELDHLCRTPACVNPAHLEPVTHRENIWRGASAKLTREIAREIRRSSEPIRLLADRYGVAGETIRRVRSGRSWVGA